MSLVGFAPSSRVHGMFAQNLEHRGSDFNRFETEISIYSFNLELWTINGGQEDSAFARKI